MGCGNSKDPKVAVNEPNSSNKSRSNRNGFKNVDLKGGNNGSNNSHDPPERSDKKPLAFVISFDENKNNGNGMHRPPPGRLQLEPIHSNPRETQAKLDKKMRTAEAKREKILSDKRRQSSVRKSGMSREGSGMTGAYSRDSSGAGRNFGRDEQNLDVPNSRNRQKLLSKMRIDTEYDAGSMEYDTNY